MSSIPSPAPRDREHRFARPHLVIVSTLEELRSLEIGCPDLWTGAAHSDRVASFLRVLERFQVIFSRLSFFFDRDWDYFCIVLCFRRKKSKCFAFWFKPSFGWKSLVDPPEKEKKPKEADNKSQKISLMLLAAWNIYESARQKQMFVTSENFSDKLPQTRQLKIMFESIESKLFL